MPYHSESRFASQSRFLSAFEFEKQFAFASGMEFGSATERGSAIHYVWYSASGFVSESDYGSVTASVMTFESQLHSEFAFQRTSASASATPLQTHLGRQF